MNAHKVPPEDVQILADAIALSLSKALQQARSVSDSEHFDHHRWISEKIIAEKWRIEFWRKMVEHTLKWGLISIITGVGYAVWLWLKLEVKS